MNNEREDWFQKQDLYFRRFCGQNVVNFIGGPLHNEIYHMIDDYLPQYYFTDAQLSSHTYAFFTNFSYPETAKTARYKLIIDNYVITAIDTIYPLYSYLFDGVQ